MVATPLIFSNVVIGGSFFTSNVVDEPVSRIQRHLLLRPYRLIWLADTWTSSGEERQYGQLLQRIISSGITSSTPWWGDAREIMSWLRNHFYVRCFLCCRRIDCIDWSVEDVYRRNGSLVFDRICNGDEVSTSWDPFPYTFALLAAASGLYVNFLILFSRILACVLCIPYSCCCVLPFWLAICQSVLFISFMIVLVCLVLCKLFFRYEGIVLLEVVFSLMCESFWLAPVNRAYLWLMSGTFCSEKLKVASSGVLLRILFSCCALMAAAL